MDSAVLAVSVVGHITLANQAAYRLLGISPPSSHSTSTLVSLPDPLRTALLDTLADGISRLQKEAILIDSGHTRLPVSYSTSPLLDEQSRILGALLVVNDLTVLKTLEAQAQHADQLASLASVAAALAHEIKNPLVAIRTSAELLDERYTDQDFRTYFANVVISEIGRIDQLLGKLHTLAAPSPSTLSLLDIREPINSTLALLRGHLELKRLTLHFTCAVDHPLILGNDSLLRQLFLNLFLNSINASPEASDLTIYISHIHRSPTDFLRISVTDAGAGVPPSILPNVFDPFVSGTQGGSGLGLAIARSIVHGHRGAIMLTNNSPCPGATVTLELPAAPSIAHTATLLPASPPSTSPVL
jgi:signal transduction histidine kinase